MAGFLIRVHQIDTYINFISGRLGNTSDPGGREKETFLQNPDEDGRIILDAWWFLLQNFGVR